ncbi:MAG: hypothetical protein ACJAXX_001284 [Roseivirga sp.]|jgi:hypothetical protein
MLHMILVKAKYIYLVAIALALLVINLIWRTSWDFQLYDTYFSLSTSFFVNCCSVVLLVLALIGLRKRDDAI